MNEDRDEVAATPIAFIVRLLPDEAARVTGTVERVRTGEKQRFHGVEAIGPLIARMLRDEGDLAGLT